MITMVENLDKAIQVAKDNTISLTKIEGELNQIYHLFNFNNDYKAKEDSFKKYLELLKKKEKHYIQIKSVINYLTEIITGLNGLNIKWYDKWIHRTRIKNMESMLQNYYSFEDEKKGVVMICDKENDKELLNEKNEIKPVDVIVSELIEEKKSKENKTQENITFDNNNEVNLIADSQNRNKDTSPQKNTIKKWLKKSN